MTAADKWFKNREDYNKFKKELIAKAKDWNYELHRSSDVKLVFLQHWENDRGEPYTYQLIIQLFTKEISKSVGLMHRANSQFSRRELALFTKTELEYFDKRGFKFTYNQSFSTQDIGDWFE